MKSGRQMAVETLLRVEKRGAWSNLALDSMLDQNGRDARESALAAALLYGVLERKITLDACIAAHSKSKLEKLSPVVKNVLRVTMYQLLYMDKVPDHAAVDEGVELIKALRMAKASGFVNGVLRSFLRSGKAIPLPSDPLERMSVEYSAPLPLVTLWMESYGTEKAEEILAASLGRPPVYLRVNTLKTNTAALAALLNEQGVEAVENEALPDCLILSGQGPIQKLPVFKEGLFHIQDLSSQLCVMALDPQPGMEVLDACAAPGGKSFTTAQYMKGEGTLVSTELHGKRVGLMERQAQRMGIANMRCMQADMTVYNPELGQFDRVLCDVPCSGLGVIRRKPEIKYKPLEEFDGLSKIQYKILSTASQYCKSGGRLLYSTCTLNPVENIQVAERFLQEHPEFEAASLPELLGGGWERTLTGPPGGDGFYMAAFQKKHTRFDLK